MKTLANFVKASSSSDEADESISFDVTTTEDVYATLPENHIRLLRLETISQSESRSEDSIALHGLLRTFPLEDAPSYVAVSYRWGDASVGYPFLCSNQELHLQENLRDLLMQLRQDDWKEWTWIDAICINQDDNEEKNHQMPLMRRIFSGAKLVLAWLGRAHDGLLGSWEFMKQLPFVFKDLQGTIGPTTLRWHGNSKPPVDFWLVLTHILYNPFFERLWVVQELVLARDIHVLCGHFLSPGMSLPQSLRRWATNQNFGATGWDTYSWNALAQLRNSCIHIRAIDTIRKIKSAMNIQILC